MPCFPPADALGTILFNGPFNPQFENLPPLFVQHENYTVTVPASLPTGPAQLSVFHVALVGVSGVYFQLINIEFTLILSSGRTWTTRGDQEYHIDCQLRVRADHCMIFNTHFWETCVLTFTVFTRLHIPAFAFFYFLKSLLLHRIPACLCKCNILGLCFATEKSPWRVLSAL